MSNEDPTQVRVVSPPAAAPHGPTGWMTRLDRGAITCFLLAAIAAPYAAGSTRMQSATCILLACCAVGAVCGSVRLFALERSPVPGKWILAALGALAVMLVVWTFQPLPPYASEFTVVQRQVIKARFPGLLWDMPRSLEIGLLLVCFLSLPAIAALGRQPRHRNRLLGAIGLVGAAIAIYAAADHWFTLPTLPGVVLSGYSEQSNVVFFHHSSTAAAILVTLPLSFALVARWRLPRAARIATLVPLLATQLVALWILHSQSAFAVVAIQGVLACLLTGVLGRRVTRPRVLTIGTCLLLAGILAMVVAWSSAAFSRNPDGWTRVEQTPIHLSARDAHYEALASQRWDRIIPSGRRGHLVGWNTAIRMLPDAFPIGHGPGSWERLEALYSEDSLQHSFHQHLQFAHHDPLQLIAEWGWIPALLVFAIAAVAVGRQSDRISTAREPMEIALFIALVSMLVACQIHFPLQVPALQYWMAVLTGLALSPVIGRRGDPTADDMTGEPDFALAPSEPISIPLEALNKRSIDGAQETDSAKPRRQPRIGARPRRTD